ncbi:MAG: dihydrodipicolinate synthase family protein [Phycisphaerae bacterium]|nr:dihydrodipicolinate synthase family protein [Phycisphaerae bacterium]
MILYEGLIAAGFTPMDKRANLRLDMIPAIVEHLRRYGLKGIYVCGSTGEGPSLSSQERKKVAQAYAQAAGGRIPIIVQVGHDSLAEAKDLAQHAWSIGADAISMVAPHYYKMDSVDTLVDCLAEIGSAVPCTPLFYYHIPALSGIAFSMREFLDAACERVPNFAGIKYSAVAIHDYQDCLDYARGRCQILFGCDEMLLSALSVGARAAIGSTYNFAAPLYYRIIETFKRGDHGTACQLQGHSVALCRLLHEYRGMPAIKTMMQFIGLDCGPTRLPLRALTNEETTRLCREVERLGFFDWISAKKPTAIGQVQKELAETKH